MRNGSRSSARAGCGPMRKKATAICELGCGLPRLTRKRASPRCASGRRSRITRSPMRPRLCRPSSDNELRALWFGDCARPAAYYGGALLLLGRYARQARKRARAGQSPGAARRPGTCRSLGARRFLPALRAARNAVNHGDGDWLFGPDGELRQPRQGGARPITPVTQVSVGERRISRARQRLCTLHAREAV
jgi:hypothetical protein